MASIVNGAPSAAGFCGVMAQSAGQYVALVASPGTAPAAGGGGASCERGWALAAGGSAGALGPECAAEFVVNSEGVLVPRWDVAVLVGGDAAVSAFRGSSAQAAVSAVLLARAVFVPAALSAAFLVPAVFLLAVALSVALLVPADFLRGAVVSVVFLAPTASVEGVLVSVVVLLALAAVFLRGVALEAARGVAVDCAGDGATLSAGRGGMPVW